MNPEKQNVYGKASPEKLADAFRIGRGDFVAVVGAGGKTTLLQMLAETLCGRGLKVLTSSTTNLQPPRPDQTDDFIIASQGGKLLERLASSFKSHNHVTLAGSDIMRKDKIKGLNPDELEAVHRAGLADVILVQADGARKRSFKAPGEHEPTVPSCATHCILVVGLDVLGEPLDERKVHRPEITARLAEQPLGSKVTLETITRVVLHPEGYLSRIPREAKRMLFLSKADSPEREQAARSLANLIPAEAYSPVLWATLRANS